MQTVKRLLSKSTFEFCQARVRIEVFDSAPIDSSKRVSLFAWNENKKNRIFTDVRHFHCPCCATRDFRTSGDAGDLLANSDVMAVFPRKN